MKEYVGSTANLYLVETTDEELRPMTELVFIVSEPKYQQDGAGGFARIRSTEELRFSTSPKGLHEIAKRLTDIAYEAERLGKRASLEPETEGGAQ